MASQTTSSRGVLSADTPKGFQAIYESCREIYPDQPNPLQVIAVVKFWNDGPDPLDYISMYVNRGDAAAGVVAHWHYVSFGLSDLHGDGRVHEYVGPDGRSGFGFELTFRLKMEAGETAPPTWPAALLQALARYVFNSGNMLYVGDHIPWHTSLDGSDSRIQHMLLMDDPQLHTAHTPHGSLSFLQVVGVCTEELKAAQHWNGPGVLEFMKSLPSVGGPWLITDMRRGETIFDINPQLQVRLEERIRADGSSLSGVSGVCVWEQECMNDESTAQSDDEESDDRRTLSTYESAQIKDTLARGLGRTAKCEETQHPHVRRSEVHGADPGFSIDELTLSRVHYFTSVHLKFSPDTAAVLPLALCGRLKHGRHFTFKNTLNESAVTLVTSAVSGSIASQQKPYAAHELWLQVLLPDEFLDEMLASLSDLSDMRNLTETKVYRWPERRLTISILPEAADD